jgi:hypothetical protein
MKKIETELKQIEYRFIRLERFEMVPNHRNKPNFFFFHEKDRNRTEADRISVLFGSNLKNKLFLFRGYPIRSAGNAANSVDAVRIFI